jgi:hypothetical protein
MQKNAELLRRYSSEIMEPNPDSLGFRLCRIPVKYPGKYAE